MRTALVIAASMLLCTPRVAVAQTPPHAQSPSQSQPYSQPLVDATSAPDAAHAPAPPWWKTSAPLRFTAIAVSIVGGGLLATGAIFGSDASDRYAAIDAARGAGTTQAQAQLDITAADAQVDTANALIGAGGAVSALGVGLLTWELINAALVPEPIESAAAVACETAGDCEPGFSCHDRACVLTRVVEVTRAADTFVVEGDVKDEITDELVIDSAVIIGGFEKSPLQVDPATGRFESWPLPAGEGALKIIAKAPGYRATEVVVPRGQGGARTTVEVRMRREGTLSTGALRGSLKHGRTGMALRGEVFVPKLQKRAKADRKGDFRLQLLPGTYEVLVSAKGFTTQRKTIKVRAGEAVILNVDLQPK